ncbi:hypothetical protein ISCGN_021927 [Ixodes scapularis]
MNPNACRPGFCCEKGHVHCNHCRGTWWCRNTPLLVPVAVRHGVTRDLPAVSAFTFPGIQPGHPIGCTRVGLSGPQILSSFGTPSYLGNAGTSTSTSYLQQPGPLLAPSHFQQAGTLGEPDHFQRASAFGIPSNCRQAGAFGAPGNLQHAGLFQATQKFQQVGSASALQGTPQADSSSWSDGCQRRAPVLLNQVEEDDWSFEPECPDDACRPPTMSDDHGTALPDGRKTSQRRQRLTYPDWSWIVMPVKRKHAMMEGTQPIRIPWDTSSLKK